jgi:type III pantothenate kinase
VKPDVVVDIGNSRIKWGQCRSGRVEDTFASLSGNAPEEWESQLNKWQLHNKLSWAVAGVQPLWQEQFIHWAEARGDRVQVITHEHINIPIEVDEPEIVGIDRLLNAVAANWLKPVTMQAIVISVGTAVTVDLVREFGSFAGGAIFPGPRLMAESLHQFTAKLPLVQMHGIELSEPPCKNTITAIQTGISYAILGGSSHLVETMCAGRKQHTWIIMTGGALGGLGEMEDFQLPVKVARTFVYPDLTLAGLRLTTKSLP